jgi:hypothetical protein
MIKDITTRNSPEDSRERISNSIHLYQRALSSSSIPHLIHIFVVQLVLRDQQEKKGRYEKMEG